MPTQLTDLEIVEVSLVTRPACAETDPKTGEKIPRARVALYKKDDSEPKPSLATRIGRLQDRCVAIGAGIAELQKFQTEMAEASARIMKQAVVRKDVHEKVSVNKEKQMSFRDVLKSARTRESIVAAVEGEAIFIAKRDHISEDRARAQVWLEHPEAQELYEATAKSEPKRPDPKMCRATKAEAELDERARKLMKAKPGISYPQAVTKVLQQRPEIYQKYENELAAGSTFEVPEAVYGEVGKAAPSDADYDDDADTCPECDEDVAAGDKFCSSCGTGLKPKPKSKSKTH